MKKYLRILSLAFVITMLLSSCGDNPTMEDSLVLSSTENSSDIQEEQVSSVPEEKLIINPLTGASGYDEALLKQRPVAVMINNIGAALPQSGISDADILYEMAVEGPVTRLMAVYSDYKKLPNIGSIRSARHDFVELVKPINALYLHFGGSVSGKQAIKDNNINNIDGTVYTNVAFYMDKERAKTRSSEHCWFSNAELLQAGIDKIKYDMSQESPTALFNFALQDVNVMDSYTQSIPASSVNVQVSGGSNAEFSLGEDMLYTKKQNGEPHIDENKKAALKFSNIFLMYTTVGLMPDNYHKEIDMSKGEGYYISAGKALEVTFKKESVNSVIKVYDKSGKEINVNVGKNYFGVCDNKLRQKLVIS